MSSKIALFGREMTLRTHARLFYFIILTPWWEWLRHVFADGGYAGPKLKGAMQKIGTFTLEIVKRTDKAKGFEALPRRWVVNRCTMLPGNSHFAW